MVHSPIKIADMQFLPLVQCLLVKFGSMIGVPVTKFWRSGVTHVIAATDTNGACTRTLKVLMAILNGRWVLTIDCEFCFVFHLVIFIVF